MIQIVNNVTIATNTVIKYHQKKQSHDMIRISKSFDQLIRFDLESCISTILSITQPRTRMRKWYIYLAFELYVYIHLSIQLYTYIYTHIYICIYMHLCITFWILLNLSLFAQILIKSRKWLGIPAEMQLLHQEKEFVARCMSGNEQLEQLRNAMLMQVDYSCACSVVLV